MHSEIKEFWKDLGYEVIQVPASPWDKYIFWTAMKTGKESFVVAAKNLSSMIISYRLSDEMSLELFSNCPVLSEEEMIKIIKQKSFFITCQ